MCRSAKLFGLESHLADASYSNGFYSLVSEQGDNLLFSSSLADDKCENGKQHSGARQAVWQTVCVVRL